MDHTKDAASNDEATRNAAPATSPSGSSARHSTLPTELNQAITAGVQRAIDQAVNEGRLGTTSWPSVSEAAKSDDGPHAIVELYRKEAATTEDDEHAVRLLTEVARLFERELGDAKSAAKAAIDAFKRRPSSTTGLQRVIRLLTESRATGQLEKLVATATGKLSSTEDKLELWLEHALYLELTAGNSEAAGRAYEEALKLSPGNAEAGEGALRLQVKREAWRGFGKLCREVADHEPSGPARRMMLLTAALLDASAPAADRALVVGQALEANSAPSDLLLGLTVELSNQAEDPATAVRVMRQQAERFPELAAPLLLLISWTQAEELDDETDAIATAEQAVEAAPQSIIYVSWLAELYQRAARWNKLAEALEQKTQLESTREDFVETLLTLAEVYQTNLGQPDKAIAAVERALELAPADLACLKALGALYQHTGQHEQLAQMHLREASVAEDDQRRAAALYRCARIYAERLDNADLAIAHLQQVIELDADAVQATRLLEDLLLRHHRHVELVALHRDQLAAAEDPTERVGLLERMGQLLENQLEDSEGALEAYVSLLELQPDHPTALRALPRLYESLGRYPQLLSALRGLAMNTPSPREKSALLTRMGQVLDEQLERPEQALAHYREAREATPACGDCFELTGRLLARLERWSELRDLYREQIAQRGDEQQRKRLRFDLGRLLEQHFDDQAGALKAYREALKIDPKYAPALRGLLRMTLTLADPREGNLESLVGGDAGAVTALRLALALRREHPERALELVENRDESSGEALAKQLRLQLWIAASNWDKVAEAVGPEEAIGVALGALGDPARALQLSKQAAEARPEDAVTLRWLDLLQASEDDPGARREVLARRGELEPAADRRAAVLLRLSHAEGGDPAAACRTILATQPEHRRAIARLEQLGLARSDDALLLEALALREPLVSDPLNKAALHGDRARLHHRRGEDVEAEQQWRRALEADGRFRPAYEALKRHYHEQGDREGLLWTLEHGLEAVSHPDARVVDLLRRADLYLEGADVSRALADLEQVLSVDAAQPNALDRVERLLRERGDLEGLAGRLVAAAEASSLPKQQAAIHLQLGQLLARELDQLQRASDHLGAALRADPDSVAALLAQAEINVRLDRPVEAVSLLDRATLRTEDAEELLAAHVGSAHISHRMLGDAERARRSLREALAIGPTNLTALRHLTDVAEELGDDEELTVYLQQLADQLEGPEERAETLGRLASALTRIHGQSSEHAASALLQALQLKPHDVALVQQMVDVLSASGRYEELATRLGKSLEVLPSDSRSSFLFLQAQILSQRLDRRAEAQGLLWELVQREPEHEQALGLLLDNLDEAEVAKDEQLRRLAIDLHRRLLSGDPTLTSSIRSLARLCRADGRADEALSAETCLVLLGAATEEEAYFHKQRRRQLPNEPTGSLSEEQRAQLLLHQGDHPIREIFARLGRHVPSIMPPDVSQYGLASLDGELPADHPAWTILKQCAAVMGVERFRVVEAYAGVPQGATEPGDPSVVLLPRDFLRFPAPHQRFICGRLLARVGVSLECFDPDRAEPMHVRDVELLLAALLRGAQPDFGEEIASPAILDDLGRRLARSIDDAELATLRQLAQQGWWERRQQDDLAGWIAGAELGLLRAGLLCGGGADSIPPFLTLTDATKRDLVGFALSAGYGSLRQQLGLALPDDA